MKLSAVLAFAAIVFASAVGAAPLPETNGQRLARGLPPMKPRNIVDSACILCPLPAIDADEGIGATPIRRQVPSARAVKRQQPSARAMRKRAEPSARAFAA
ncbi:hypothetical protein BD626DRAFT_411028 [Schizophyllum amplum]|uniref:Uncharacterized protein n=1 Tax=Schizophyllum amplum TaxID=97359 RepID=A0A550BZT6_9AGAR|nr:hypothetical protein BD626DRAFT_411028 [Auriculariopsis ampla]